MPEISQCYNYQVNYNGADWVSTPLFMANAVSISFIVKSSVNCTMAVTWISDDTNLTIIETDSLAVVENIPVNLIIPIKKQFAILYLKCFASNRV